MEKKCTFFCIGILLIITASIPAAETPRDGKDDLSDQEAKKLFGKKRVNKGLRRRAKALLRAAGNPDKQRLAPGDGGAGRASDSSGVSSDESGGEEMLPFDQPANLGSVPPVPPLKLTPTLPPPPPPLQIGASAPGTPHADTAAAPTADATPRSKRLSLIGALKGLLTGGSNPGSPRTAPPSMPGTPRAVVTDVGNDATDTLEANTTKSEDGEDDAQPEEMDDPTPYGSWPIAALASTVMAGDSQTAIEMEERAASSPQTHDDVPPVADHASAAIHFEPPAPTTPVEERKPGWKQKGPATPRTDAGPAPQTPRSARSSVRFADQAFVSSVDSPRYAAAPDADGKSSERDYTEADDDDYEASGDTSARPPSIRTLLALRAAKAAATDDDDWREPPTPHRPPIDDTGRYFSEDGDDDGGDMPHDADQQYSWRDSSSTHAQTARQLVQEAEQSGVNGASDATARRPHSSRHRHRHRSQASKPQELTLPQQGVLNSLCETIIAYTTEPDPVKLTMLAARAEELGIINRPITHEDSLPIKNKVADIAVHKKFEMTALDIAVMMEHPQQECVKILLNHRADPNRKERHTQRTPLIRFCKNSMVADAAIRPIISMLIKHNAAIGLRDHNDLNALHYACGTERHPVVSMAMVKALLDKGSKVDGDVLYCACTNPRVSEELVEFLLGYQPPISTKLITKMAKHAVRHEIVALVMRHAEAHAATVAEEEAAKQRTFQGLCNALATAQYSSLPAILSTAQDLELINHKIPEELANPSQTIYAGDTPLILACRRPYPRHDVLRQLSEATAKTSVQSTHDGCTALAAFCQNGEIRRETIAAIISLLAAKKSLVLKCDDLGRTPAIIACAASRRDGTMTAAIIEALIQCNPNLTLAERDSIENTAMDVACCNTEILQGHLPLIRALCPPNRTTAPAYPRDELARYVTEEARSALQQRDAIARGVRRLTVADIRRAEKEAAQNAARVRSLNAPGDRATQDHQ